jgi:dephospho-CoA kinase
MCNPIIRRTKKEIENKQGIVLLDGALLAEAKLTNLCGNKIILVGANKKIQKKRLGERGLTKEQIQRRISSQYTFAEKKKTLQKVIKRDGSGKLWVIKNPDYNDIQKILMELARLE